MRKKYSKYMAWAVVNGNEICLYAMNGSPIGGEMILRVTDDVSGIPTFFIKGCCNIVGSRAEMYEHLGMIAEAVQARLEDSIRSAGTSIEPTDKT